MWKVIGGKSEKHQFTKIVVLSDELQQLILNAIWMTVQTITISWDCLLLPVGGSSTV